jgi:hypothetical protein
VEFRVSVAHRTGLTTNATLDPCLCSVIQAETICRCPSPNQDLDPGHIVIMSFYIPAVPWGQESRTASHPNTKTKYRAAL